MALQDLFSYYKTTSIVEVDDIYCVTLGVTDYWVEVVDGIPSTIASIDLKTLHITTAREEDYREKILSYYA